MTILCTGGPDVIRKEAWPSYRTIPVCAYAGSSRNLKDLKDTICVGAPQPDPIRSGAETKPSQGGVQSSELGSELFSQSAPYRGTSLIRNAHPPRTTIGPLAKAYCRVVGGGIFLSARCPCTCSSARDVQWFSLRRTRGALGSHSTGIVSKLPLVESGSVSVFLKSVPEG